jgi:hypothetical protein
MLTHGWSRYKWDEVVSAKQNIEFMPEHRGHILRGKLMMGSPETPASGITALVSSPSKNIQFFADRSKGDGSVQFEMKDFYGPRKMYLSTPGALDNTYQLELTSPFSTASSTYLFPELLLSPLAHQAINLRSLDMQLQNIFNEETNRVIDPTPEVGTFYGTPDEKYRLDDYTRFPTMEEVMREYVIGIMVRKRKDEYRFVTIEKGTTSVFRDNPLVLIDGVPIEKVDQIMAFDPRKIERLDVMTQKYYFGHLAMDGVASYSTYGGDLGGFEVDPKTLSFNYEGFQLQREFFSPKYEIAAQRESRIPDSRDLLFWSGSVTADPAGKSHLTFYTSDVPGKFIGTINGLTAQGEAGSASFTFEVSSKDNY